MHYKIALSDFIGLELTDLKIPFALWNPKNNTDAFLNGEVLVDNLHLTN